MDTIAQLFARFMLGIIAIIFVYIAHLLWAIIKSPVTAYHESKPTFKKMTNIVLEEQL